MRVLDAHKDHPIERLLGYEGLSSGKRAPVDEHLAACEACRTLRSRIIAAEASPAAMDSIPFNPADAKANPLTGLDAATRADAAASQADLLAALNSRGGSRMRWSRFLIPALIAVVAVVAVAVVVFLLRT